MKQEVEDKIISDFLQSLGPWREYVTIGGGYALIVYKIYLADKELKNPPVGTRDIDSLIPRKVPDVSQEDIAKHLNNAGFQKRYKDYNDPATESYAKDIEGLEIEIEFLTDNSARVDKDKNVLIAGIVAQPLRYLTLSLQSTLTFQTYSGLVGEVVSPEAWIFHKGLTFTKRKSASKMLKDLYGIWYVVTQLGSFSDRAIQAFKELAAKNSKWFTTFQKNLQSWIENASPANWSSLEAQDPAGKLKKLSFESGLKRLLEHKIF